jgi:hypothetical protein
MGVNRFGLVLVAGILGLGVTAFASRASAADMPVKAPPPSPWVLDVHGIFDVTFANDYITPRGLLVTNTGLTTQILAGLGVDIYKDKYGFINDISISAYTWNDLWSQQNDPHVGSWNEFDWGVVAAVKFAQYWKLSVEYGEFLPPAHDLITSFPSTERHVEVGLFYDDSWWWRGVPFAINPYVKFFGETSGPSVVVLGARERYDVELGIVPTYDFGKVSSVPVTVTVPTWITVGPSSFWNKNVFIAGPGGGVGSADIMNRFFAGASNFCGPLSNEACANSNAGVFSTGLKATLSLTTWIPKRLGNWYVKGGVQYFHIINDALLAAQIFTGAAGGASNLYGAYPLAHRDIGVGYGGLGFTF